MLEGDAFDGVGDMSQLVQGLLDTVGDVLPAQHVLGRMLGGEVVQLGADPAMQLVAFMLQVIDGGQVGVEAVGVELVQAAHALAGVLGRSQQHAGLLGHRVQGLGDAVEEDHVADLLDGVGDVVEPFGQLEDVVAVQAGDEGGGQPGQDGAGDAVALMLQVGQVLGLGLGGR